MSNISVGSPLLLTNIKRDGLFILPDSSSYLLIQMNQNGDHVISELTQNACRQIHISLRGVGERYLNLKGPEPNTIMKYLVTPEMEVERIFNCLRFKYLNAIYLSNFQNPQQFITYKYNKAFQTLSGLTIYQGNPPQRRVNDSYWQDAGFTIETRDQNWQKEHHNMQRIIAILKRISSQSLSRLYAELIAIKPGFHELYVHHNYFERSTIPRGKSTRDEVFRLLRNIGDISALSLDRLPAEINKNNYISYAPCNVTEGPFVCRKRPSVSYVSEIRRITSITQLPELEDNFHILDYYSRDLSTRDKLAEFLQLAKPFCTFMT